MNAQLQATQALPDVANDPAAATALAWVGMHGLTVPVQAAADPASWRCGVARADAEVNLPADAGRGIHMSRLYTEVQAALASKPLHGAMLDEVLQAFLRSHAGISQRARLRLRFDLLARRDALLSERSGWKLYPCRVEARRDGVQASLELECRIGYSSTCPASAALARQLVQQAFARQFPGEEVPRQAVFDWLGSEAGMAATPHGQRSEACVRVRLAPGSALDLAGLIEQVESALATPLQSAVKRRDEQEFARLNGENLMFCEDAARRVHAALAREPAWLDFAIRCEHFESLHPHDAVAVAVKGVEGGYDG